MTTVYETNESASKLITGQGPRRLQAQRRPPPHRRLRPHLGVRPHPAHPHPRQGARPHPDLQLLVRQTEHIIANHIVDPDPGPEWYPEIDWFYDDLRGRTVLVRNAQPLVIECIVRGYLAGSGWKEYQQQRHGLRHPAAGGPAASPTGCPSRSSRRPPRPRSAPRREHLLRARGAHRRRGAWRRRCATLSLALYEFAAALRAASAASSSPTPSSSSALLDGEADPHRRGAHARLLPLLARRRLRARRAASRASTSSSCATTSRRSTGTRRRPAPAAATRWWRRPARSTWRRGAA